MQYIPFTYPLDLSLIPARKILLSFVLASMLILLSGCDQSAMEEDSTVYLIVDQMPELIGGLSSIQSRITYPEEAKRAGIEGRVFVQFTVDEEGDVIDAEVVQGIGYGCDEAALNAVRQAKFIPGRQNGVIVRVRMSIPITFKLV